MARRRHSETFTVGLPIERVWEVMADTQHLNQLFFGFNASKIEKRDGEKARIRGSFGALAPVYDEYPWVFEVPKHFKSLRVFEGGLLKRLETECKLEEKAPASTSVEYTMVVETVAGPIGAVAAFVTTRRTRVGLEKTRELLQKMVATPDSAPIWPPANPQREAVAQRASAVVDGLTIGDRDERKAIEKLVEHVAEAPEPDVARMRPYELADQWGVPRKKMLTACLRATRGGLLRLSWDLLCQSCEAPTSIESLKNLPDGGHCPACDVDFATNFEQNVEATFSPEPAVRQSERLVFCHGSPSSTKSWLAQFMVDPGQKHELKLRLGTGRYRLQAAGIQGNTLIDVEDDATGNAVNVGIETLQGQARLPAVVPPAKKGEVRFVVENKGDKPRRVQVAHRKLASKAATAADVTALGLFKELFGGEALAPDQHLAVGQGSIMFTDLCGSTAMYERLGDAAAYGLVREHFRLLFAEVEKERGRVVKTVGDCVMAAFDSPLEAARAGRACILALRMLKDKEGKPPGLELKVGVHTGPCLAVEANNQIDYFGRTVNIAARVESLAGHDELVLSWTAAGDRAVREMIAQCKSEGDAIVEDKRPIKGVDGEVDIVRIGVRK